MESSAGPLRSLEDDGRLLEYHDPRIGFPSFAVILISRIGETEALIDVIRSTNVAIGSEECIFNCEKMR